MAKIVEGVTLKPCPLCGSSAQLKTDSATTPNGLVPFCFVKCSNRACAVSTQMRDSQHDAVTLWDTRSK